jgi:hypothetical protein
MKSIRKPEPLTFHAACAVGGLSFCVDHAARLLANGTFLPSPSVIDRFRGRSGHDSDMGDPALLLDPIRISLVR